MPPGPSHSLADALRRPSTRAVIAALIVLALFVIALLLWAGSSDDNASPPAPTSSSPTSGATDGLKSTTASLTPSGDVTSSGGSDQQGGTLPPLPGAPVSGVNSTRLSTYGPGLHRVVIEATSDKAFLGLAYSVKGERAAHQFTNVRSPVVIRRTLTGDGPFAAISLQVGPTAHRGTCRITVDGKVAAANSTAMPYGVTACLA